MFNIGPYTGGNRIKLDKPGYLRVWLLVVVLFGLIVLYVFEFKHFDLVLNPKLLLAYAVALGTLSGVILAGRFSRGISDSFERMRIYMILIVVSIFFMPLLVNLANRHLDFRTPEIRDISLENIEAYISEKYGILKGEDVKVAGYKIVVVMDQEVLQLKSKLNPFPNNKPGDIVQIAIYKGLFGIEYVGLKGN